MVDVCIIGPFAVPLPPPNARHGRKTFDGGSLVSQQRAMVRAAFSGRCSVCGVPRTAVRPRGAKWSGALYTYGCEGHAGRLVPYRLPLHGPEHPVDIHVVRVPKYRGRALDAYENGPFATKPIADEITFQLWPKGSYGKPVSNPDDSAPWLRWSYGERPHRKPKTPRKLPPGWVPGPPDPPNQGTELCEIWIAEREDCCPDGVARTLATWQRCLAKGPAAKSMDGGGLLGMQIKRLRESEHGSADWALADLIETIGETGHVGCDRSRLPIRWARGEIFWL